MKSRLVVFIALICLLTNPLSDAASSNQKLKSWNGPFGLKMGLSKKDLARYKITEIGHGLYKLSSVPKPHPSMKIYYVNISDEAGLCQVIGESGDIQSSVYGDTLKNSFDSLKDALNKKYGPSKNYDYLRTGSIWSESKDWMMALRKEERVLSSFWPESDQYLKSDSEIRDIFLSASAQSSEIGSIILIYRFSNFDRCDSESKNVSNSSL